jgi:N-acetyl sugar amidotransferase
MKSCSKCLLPETHETIEFDSMGECNICNQHKFKKEKIDWKSKSVEFEKIIENYRGKYNYDCIVPFSGGKDSVFTLYKLAKIHNLKCLVVSFDHTFFRPKLIENRQRIFKKLGVDCLTFTPNWELVQKLMLETFIRKGDFCWHCHSGIFAYPMQVAIKEKVPLVIWGEPQAEYTAYYSYEDTLNETEEVDEERFNKFVNLGITADDMYEMLNDPNVQKRDLAPYVYPDLSDLKKIKYRSICLGSYFPWDVKNQVEIIKKELGWEEDLNAGIPPEYAYEKVECQMQGIRDYIKFIKRGSGRTAHLSAIDIRNKRIGQNLAKKNIEEFDGKKPKSLDIFLNNIGIKEEEFNKIVKSHAVFPANINPENLEEGVELPDQKKWDTSSPMNRKYSKDKLEEHGISDENENK